MNLFNDALELTNLHQLCRYLHDLLLMLGRYWREQCQTDGTLSTACSSWCLPPVCTQACCVRQHLEQQSDITRCESMCRPYWWQATYSNTTRPSPFGKTISSSYLTTRGTLQLLALISALTSFSTRSGERCTKFHLLTANC